MGMLEKFLPYKIYKTIYDIDFKELYDSGKRFIIFDLDNTIIPYEIDIPSNDSVDLVNNLKEIGFKMILMSNNHSKRVFNASSTLGIDTIANAKKPFKYGYKKAIKKYNLKDVNEIIAIGDQLVTDVYGASKTGIKTIYVNAINRNGEHWYTRINRKFENIVLRKFKRKYNDVYKQILKIRGIENA